MESEFEPAVRMEETPEARIVIVDLPGFRKENLKLQIDNGQNLIISGERGVKDMTKVGGRLEETQRFRKVIGVPQNLNIDGRITAKFRDQTLRVTLPLLHISDQQNQEAIPASGKTVQSAHSKDERSSPAGQQDSMQEGDQRARHREATRQEDDKAKGSAGAEELKELAEGRKTETPKLGRDFVHGEPPISKDTQAVSGKAGARDQSEFIQSKSKQDEEEQEEEEAYEEEESDDEEEESDDEEEDTTEDEDKGEGDEHALPLPDDKFPDKRSQIPYCTRRSRFFSRCCIVL